MLLLQAGRFSWKTEVLFADALCFTESALFLYLCATLETLAGKRWGTNILNKLKGRLSPLNWLPTQLLAHGLAAEWQEGGFGSQSPCAGQDKAFFCTFFSALPACSLESRVICASKFVLYIRCCACSSVRTLGEISPRAFGGRLGI